MSNIRKVYIAQIVKNRATACRAPDQRYVVSLEIRHIYFGQRVLISAYNDSRLIAPETEKLIAEAGQKILFQRDIECRICTIVLYQMHIYSITTDAVSVTTDTNVCPGSSMSSLPADV